MREKKRRGDKQKSILKSPLRGTCSAAEVRNIHTHKHMTDNNQAFSRKSQGKGREQTQVIIHEMGTHATSE